MSTTRPPDEELPSNWGRWGLGDRLGTLNHITDEARARGARTVRSGQAVSLAMPVTPVLLAGGGPMPVGTAPMPAPVLQMMNYNPAPPVYTDILVLNTHHVAMTHIDAHAHIPVDGKVYPGVPAEQAISRGTVRHGSTTAFAAGITTRGVLLDLAPGRRLEPGHTVTGIDLDDAQKRAGVLVEPGDALVVRGGWTVHRDFKDPLPAMSLDAVRWMAEREVSLYIGDIGDRPPADPAAPIPMHHVALARLGLPIVDGAELSELAATCARLGRWEFLLALAIPAILQTTGLPANPLAIF